MLDELEPFRVMQDLALQIQKKYLKLSAFFWITTQLLGSWLHYPNGIYLVHVIHT